jgi:hypothetical protein
VLKSSLESGDYVWAKTEGAFVPYSRKEDHVAQEFSKQLKEFEKRIYSLRPDEGKVWEGTFERRPKNLREYQAAYFSEQNPNDGQPLSARVEVGHVGIVSVDRDKIYVVEALLSEGVSKRSLDDWLKERMGQSIWVGRLKGYEKIERAKIAIEAEKFIGKPYSFFGFDLDDESGFYCSKLAWLATKKGTGVALDGNDKAERTIWFSPKQMLHLSSIEKIFSSGDF